MKPWTPKEIALLGTMTDAALAKKLGRTAISVRRKRDEQGIAAHNMHRWVPTQSQVNLLGTKSDTALAKKFGVSRLTVLRERNSRGIAAYSRW